MHEARYTEDRGWYVVDCWGHLVHTPENGELRAAFFHQDRRAAEALADRLNALSPDLGGKDAGPSPSRGRAAERPSPLPGGGTAAG